MWGARSIASATPNQLAACAPPGGNEFSSATPVSTVDIKISIVSRQLPLSASANAVTNICVPAQHQSDKCPACPSKAPPDVFTPSSVFLRCGDANSIKCGSHVVSSGLCGTPACTHSLHSVRYLHNYFFGGFAHGSLILAVACVINLNLVWGDCLPSVESGINHFHPSIACLLCHSCRVTSQNIPTAWHWTLRLW